MVFFDAWFGGARSYDERKSRVLKNVLLLSVDNATTLGTLKNRVQEAMEYLEW